MKYLFLNKYNPKENTSYIQSGLRKLIHSKQHFLEDTGLHSCNDTTWSTLEMFFQNAQ